MIQKDISLSSINENGKIQGIGWQIGLKKFPVAINSIGKDWTFSWLFT